MFYIENSSGYERINIWKDEIPFACEHKGKKNVYLRSGKTCWHEGIICMEVERRINHTCNHAMVCMRYISDPKDGVTYITINYGGEDMPFSSPALSSYEKVSVGLEEEFVEAIEEFFVVYDSHHELPEGTIEILFGGYGGVDFSNDILKETMALLVFVFEHVDLLDNKQLEREILKRIEMSHKNKEWEPK